MLGYLIGLATVTLIAIMLAASLNIMVGYSRIYSLAHGSIYGIGAYSAALIAIHMTSNLVIVSVTAMFVGMLAGIILATIAARIHFEYFVVASLGFQIVLDGLFSNWQSVTGGPSGLSGIPALSMFGVSLGSPTQVLVVVLVVTLVTLMAIWGLTNSRWGRRIKAVGDDEIGASTLGIRPSSARVLASAASGLFAGWAGAMFAYNMAFINSDSFTSAESVSIMAMVILGGAGTFWGPVIGAVFITVIPALLGYMSLPPAVTGLWEELIFGVLLILMMRFQPSGLIGIIGTLRRKSIHVSGDTTASLVRVSGDQAEEVE
ncbi:branched-chain amino acid ABC transporter permease [Alicyclobacillus tolerans]|uniref:branched-chain amino acid ABC transporter permease n=1 Tax=Alicyclobacillus tolerans TaxID=90970 RepID=UPI001F2830C3|nr:branched-chain amino acid ABC transporter permease [Alicyclobacillus tolerans]MCF8565750.1 branched-chain amino acid ABC transporter permease [Alicyclobacillus tolerans]